MHKLKKLILLTTAAVFCSAGYAEVIDLDVYNADHCRQQILDSKDELPIIMTYFRDCGWAQKFMPVYEAVAKEHPERTFFRFDYQDAVPHSVLAQCIDQLGGTFSPQLRVIAVVKDPDTGEKFRMPPLRVDGDGRWTKEDVVKFMNVTEMKKRLSLNNHSATSK